METNNAFPQTARRRATVFLLACLGALLFAAVVYRVENPTIVQHEEQRQMPGGGGSMDKMGDMGAVSAMMKRLQDNPEDLETMRSLGMAFMEMQAWERALAFWDMVLERHDDFTEVFDPYAPHPDLIEAKHHDRFYLGHLQHPTQAAQKENNEGIGIDPKQKGGVAVEQQREEGKDGNTTIRSDCRDYIHFSHGRGDGKGDRG